MEEIEEVKEAWRTSDGGAGEPVSSGTMAREARQAGQGSDFVLSIATLESA